MNIDTFARLVHTRFAFCEALLVRKNKEYAEDGDKLSNFKQASALKSETPERALWGMQAKHLISLKKIIYDLDGGIIPSESLLAEKISDNINYLLLLEALITERRHEPQPPAPPERIICGVDFGKEPCITRLGVSRDYEKP